MTTAAAPALPTAGPGVGSGPVPGFSERLGRALLFPRSASQALYDGQPGGLRDAAMLFLPRLLAGDVRRLSSELHDLVEFSRLDAAGLRAGLQFLLDAAAGLLPDLLGILLGGVVMSLALGQSERRLRPGLTVDLAAQAWFGWLFVHVLAALGQTLLQRQPEAQWSAAVQWLALAVWVFYMIIGFLTVRRALAGSAAAPPPGGS